MGFFFFYINQLLLPISVSSVFARKWYKLRTREQKSSVILSYFILPFQHAMVQQTTDQ